MPSKGKVTGLAAAGVAAAGAAAAGALLERSARARRSLSTLDPLDLEADRPDHVLTVIASDGVRLHVEVDLPATTGHNPDLPTVVLAHGFTLSSRSWVLQRRALRAAGHRVITWDQRSHGRSGRGEAEHATIDQLGRDLHDVLAAAAPEGPLMLVGHSMGGMTVMSFGGDHPQVLRDRVVAVALVATSAGGGGLTNLGANAFVGMLVGRLGPTVLHRLGRIADVVTRVRRLGRPLEDALVEHYSFDSPVSEDLVRFAADMIFSTPYDAMADFLPALENMDERPSLEAFRGIETIVINGRGDLLTPPEHSDRIVAGIPGAEHVIVEDAGHLIMLEHPDIVTQQIAMAADRGVRARVEHLAIERKPRVRRSLTDVARRRRVEHARTGA